jgi:hypothetical protein
MRRIKNVWMGLGSDMDRDTEVRAYMRLLPSYPNTQKSKGHEDKIGGT